MAGTTQGGPAGPTASGGPAAPTTSGGRPAKPMTSGGRPAEPMTSGGRPAEPTTSGRRPALRVIRGNPSPEEVAALVAVLTAGAARGAGAEPARRSATGWRDRAAMLNRPPLHHAPGAWRASAHPH